jgi:hypothetical protein
MIQSIMSFFKQEGVFGRKYFVIQINPCPCAFLHRGGESRGSRGTLRKQDAGALL